VDQFVDRDQDSLVDRSTIDELIARRQVTELPARPDPAVAGDQLADHANEVHLRSRR
jgi:hypothetical protein